jgi:hypothetical protein
MKSKLYLETTVPSYLTARPSRDLIVAAHQQITHEWWEMRRHNFEIFILSYKTWPFGPGHSSVVLPSEQYLLLKG